MRKANVVILVVLFILFLLSTFAYGKYDEVRREKDIPYRYKDVGFKSPTYTAHGLFFLDGYLWISSSSDHALLQYDLETETVVRSLPVPCFEAAGLTYDGKDFWVADYSKKTIYRISPEGDVLNSYNTPYSTPWGLAWDGRYLWICDVYGFKEYPDLSAALYPNSILYQYDPETDTVLKIIDSPAPFSGDIAYREGELIISGCSSREIFHIDIETGETTLWYYSPDPYPRAVAVGEDNTVFVSGMITPDIWEVFLNREAQWKDFFRIHDVRVPGWIILIFMICTIPILMDELLKRKYTKKRNVWEEEPKWWQFWKE
jgi:outer membrane protein assembly factor BamB